MTEPARAEGDDGRCGRPVDPIPLPPDPMAPWLGAIPATDEAEEQPDRPPGERT